MIREKDLNILYKKAQLKLSQKGQKDTTSIPNSYVIKLTTECNLRCYYCYMGSCSNDYEQMSNDLFEQILDQIKNVTQKFTIYLHGGEPCLRLDLIENLKSWIDKNRLNDSVTIMLQTNGTIVNQEIIDLIKSMKINVGISLDGIDDASNHARVFKDNNPTIGYVLKNIEKLLSHNITVGIFSVLTAYNASKMPELIKHLVGIGIRNFVINPLVLWGNAENMNKLMATQDQVYKTYKELIDWLGNYNSLRDSDEQVTERNLHWWFRGMVDGIKGYMCNCSPCGAGIQTIAISPTGNVYVCDQYYGDHRFLIGNLMASTLESIIQSAQPLVKSLRNIYNIDTCKQCVWRYVCCGGCSASSFYYSGNMRSVAPYCEAYKQIFSYLDIKLQNNKIVL